MEVLWLHDNAISDISVLEGLTRLRELRIDSNHIPDLSVLQKLTRLTRLQADINSLSDFFLLKELNSLQTLRVEIEDRLPLTFLVDGEKRGGVLRVDIKRFDQE